MTSPPALLVLLLSALLCGCSGSNDTAGTGDTDDAPAYPTLVPCDGGVLDPSTGWCWQEPFADTPMEWQDAIAWCDALELAGHDDWRLPNIPEVRTLFRGCAGVEPGGACDARDEPTVNRRWDPACSSCESLQGPGPAGCYWDAAFGSDCVERFFYLQAGVGGGEDSSVQFVMGAVAWFDYGWLGSAIEPQTVRCVRDDTGR